MTDDDQPKLIHEPSPGLTDQTAIVLRKALKYTQHLPLKNIFIAGVADEIQEWGVVSAIVEEFELPNQRPSSVTDLLKMCGYEEVFVIPDDVYDFSSPFSSDILFDHIISFNNVPGKMSNPLGFFKNIHNLATPDATIVHSAPWQNQKDDSYYAINPKFWARLAQAQEYTCSGFLLVSGQDIERLEHPSLDGTKYELMGKYKTGDKQRPCTIYGFFHKSGNNEFVESF